MGKVTFDQIMQSPGFNSAVNFAGNAFGNYLNAQQVHNANRANIEFQWKMYERQRADAWNDWVRMNAYNSPQEQMRRFKEAGLNPNLIYGKGDSGNAGPIRSSSANNPGIQPIRIDPSMIGDAVNTYFNVMRQKQEIDNLAKQNQVMDTQITLNNVKAITEGNRPDLIKSQIGNLKQLAEYTQQKREQGKDMFPGIMDIQRQQILNLKTYGQLQQQLTKQAKENTGYIHEKSLSVAQMREVEYLKMKQDIEIMKLQAKDIIPQQKEKIIKQIQLLDKQINEVEDEINIGGLKFGIKSKTRYSNNNNSYNEQKYEQYGPKY